MKVMASSDDFKQWRFRDALREKAGLNDNEIEKLFAEADPLELVEFGMALEEGWGIQISDEHLFDLGGNSEDPLV